MASNEIDGTLGRAGFEGKDLLSTDNFSREDIEELISLADFFYSNPMAENFKFKSLALCILEDSTRTYESFKCAMEFQGGKTTGRSGAEGTSIKKGESLEDTIKVYDSYGVDCIVIRHKEAGSAARAAGVARAPVINAGDGTNEHPTQTLVDLYTIIKRKEEIDGLTVGIVGDLKHGRTVHSLALGLAKYDTNIYFISQDGLRVGEEWMRRLSDLNAKVKEIPHTDLTSVCKELDVLYMTRLQAERFEDLDERERIEKGYPRIGISILQHSKKDLMIMHPLPRKSGQDCELSLELDNTPNAAYFEQTKYSLPLRQALLAEIFGIKI